MFLSVDSALNPKKCTQQSQLKVTSAACLESFNDHQLTGSAAAASSLLSLSSSSWWRSACSSYFLLSSPMSHITI